MARVACWIVATACAGVLCDVAVAQPAFAQPTNAQPVPLPENHSPSPSPPSAQPAAAAPASAQPGNGQPAKPAGQGIAVLAIGPARDEAFALARAIYGSRLRPTSLDEVRARVLAGAPPPANASRELRELAELRAGVTGEDAAGRRLLSGLAQQVGAQALLVVRVEPSAAQAPTIAPPPPPPASAADDAGTTGMGGAAGDAGASDAGSAAGNLPAAPTVVARLFLADSGDFDAARYAPELGLQGAAAWKSTVTSLEGRFPATSRTVGPGAAIAPAPVKMRLEDEKSTPFYASAWFWGAVGGAALLGAGFYFASRDTGDRPIHLQMRVPK
jgi:hypothetical protein